MATAVSALSSVLRIAVVSTARFLAAIPINMVTLPVGVILFALAALLDIVGSDSATDVRVQSMDIVAWGWAWWPFEVEIERKVK